MSSALVTGASSGIGREISKALASEVDRLVVTARSADELHTLKKELSDLTSVEVIIADLSIQSEVEKVVQKAGDIDILVNNAGYGIYGRIVDQDSDELVGIVDLNIRAPFPLRDPQCSSHANYLCFTMQSSLLRGWI